MGVVGEANACVVLAGKATVPEEVVVVATEAPDDGAILAGDAVEGVRMPGTDKVVAIGEFIDRIQMTAKLSASTIRINRILNTYM